VYLPVPKPAVPRFLLGRAVLSQKSALPTHSWHCQQDFKRQLIGAVIAKSKASEVCPKRIMSHISQGADDLPLGHMSK
jgi:hypothetical protein